ncbi:Hpt domain-containing protein [Variovorax terrae]|uniref:Chemotaxis protein CheA n=1 Tax=Variovorax terrae TaxID=2923278 RepID=A0A9X2AN64_9BURK|nr:Hpt domain-containing protein [Variovorax terrae]MCJ0762067.1 Hpt domain-containing protein [Variovorax terrae]
MLLNEAGSAAPDLDLAANDLGPLAWVLDELRKSLDGAGKALRRFVRDAEMARGSDLAAVDASQLRIARQQLHQAVGALEMVGLSAPALVLHAMEAVVQKFVQRPELCSDDAASKVERASFALTEYLESVLTGKPVSPVALFPQYRDVQELAGGDRVHPADLWTLEWRWLDPELHITQAPQAYDAAVRARFDQAVLKVVKSGDAAAARILSDVSLGFAAAQTVQQPRAFWKVCAAYFEALALQLVPPDLYTKRAASRVLLQYTTLVKGDLGVSDRLAQDLLFFCSQAVPQRAAEAPALSAVRQAWGLARFKPVDYEASQFGRFDPALLAQARKRISAAKESWSALSGGDAGKLKTVSDQFSLVCDSLTRLYPASEPLAQALTRVIESMVRAGEPPATELAMEVATSVLYLEAAFEDLDPSDSQLAARMVRLSERLENARSGRPPEALEPWMEELYRRVSDRQTMGSVVGELRTTLGELEKSLDQFFRNPQDKASLRDVPGQLSQMRGVLSVLGLDQASQAVLRMRDSVEQILVTEIDEERARAAGTFDKLGNNLGALGFLIDMLNYQPALAKKLFIYDDERGELKPLMGRTGHTTGDAVAAVTINENMLSQEVRSVVQEVDQGVIDSNLTVKLDTLAEHAALADQPGLAQSAREAAAAVSANDAGAAASALTQLAATAQPVAAVTPAVPVSGPDFAEDDLRDIFLEEAREVVQTGLEAIQALAQEPDNMAQQTTLRRAFHTLKGSSRMVGLTEFGEAAWSLEQLLNAWLAEQKPVSEELCALSGAAMQGFGRWVEDIAAGTDARWKASMFRTVADALRLDSRVLPLALPDSAPAALPEPVAAADSAAIADPIADIELPSFDEPLAAPAEPLPQVAAPELEPDFAFDIEPAAAQAPVQAQDHGPAPVPEPVLLDIDGIDFASLSVVSDTANMDEPVPAPVAEPEPVVIDLDDTFAADFTLELPPEPAAAVAHALAAPEMAAELPPAFDPVVAATPAPVEPLEAALDLGDFEVIEPAALPEEPEVSALAGQDEQVKVIGSLRIGIPLYNVYLNEADEWSRRLVTEVTEWALELHRPVADSTVGLAHSLAGSSATVGFHALSDMARALEHALQHAQGQSHGSALQGQVFTQAAEDIRRLLHQFAAGFLKEPDAQVLQALKDLETAEPPAAPPSVTIIHAVEPAAELHAAPVFEEKAVEVQAALAPSAPHFIAPAATVVAAPVVIQDEQEDDIDAVDAIDADLFPIFEEEALELLPQLGGALRQWSARPENLGARDEVLRALHTLKGSARLSGALRLGELAHRMESEIEYFGSQQVLQTSQFEPLLHRFDGLQANFDALRLRDLQAQQAPVPEPAVIAAAVAVDAAPTAAAPGATHSVVALPAATMLAPLRQASNQAVRVRSQLLDRLVNQAGEVMITRSRLEAELSQLRGSLGDLSGNLDRLRAQLRDIELQAESQMQSRLAQAKDSAAGFDPLEFDRFTRVQELTRMMAESVNDVATVQRNLQRTVEATEDDLIAQARQTRELQRDLLRTRMVEFEGISERLYRVVRQASKDTGKQVKLDITGGSIEMDRGVLDRMTPAFEHLLRNCVAHGIEDPAVRTAAGKDASGTILIGLHHEGNDVSVEFRDDGAGLNLPRIREKALAQGLIAAGQELSDADAANLIFMPGFSTAAQVTELAGRGIGMDVVRSEVNALGGRIETSTQAGQGTAFKLVLPLTTAVTQVVMMRSGNFSIGVPANVVEIVRRATVKELQQAYNSASFEFGGESVPFFWSGALLQSSQRSSEPQGRTIPVVLFRSAAQRIAVHVDEVLGSQEVVVKNLGPQLSRLPGLAGMSVLASGAVVLIYNPVALATVYGEQARTLSADQAQPHVLGQAAAAAGTTLPSVESAPPQVPLVLVVDDSITVRRVTQRLLQREGYRVALAADGLQALERLQEERPTVVLSDIEMPRMDGFDLARNIRGDARLHDLPIVMITSRIAEKHRDHAKELGVNHYLGKPYSEEELLGLVRAYATAEIPA